MPQQTGFYGEQAMKEFSKAVQNMDLALENFPMGCCHIRGEESTKNVLGQPGAV